MATMRIAHVNDIAAVASTLARSMRELGEDAVVVEPRRLQVRRGYPLRTMLIPFRAGGIVEAGIALRRGRFDVVHVHYGRLGMLGPMSGRPYTLHLHGTDIRGVRPGSWWGRETTPFIDRARLVYYATPDLREWVEPFRPDAIFLPNPIETDIFRPAGGVAGGGAGAWAAAMAGSAAGAAPEPRDLLVGVRLSAIKGLDTIVEVVRRLAADRPATTITIVAQGEGVAAVAAAAGPRGIVVTRTDRAHLPDLIRGHRLALGQFLVGTVGNYELEALACGVPVVMRFDRGDAYPTPPPLVAAWTAEEAAARIGELLDDDASLRALAAQGPGWVAANHEAHAVAQRVLDDYRRTGQGPR
jgi:glycosyltransferase involved in cell wall biosynthesis